MSHSHDKNDHTFNPKRHLPPSIIDTINNIKTDENDIIDAYKGTPIEINDILKYIDDINHFIKTLDENEEYNLLYDLMINTLGRKKYTDIGQYIKDDIFTLDKYRKMDIDKRLASCIIHKKVSNDIDLMFSDNELNLDNYDSWIDVASGGQGGGGLLSKYNQTILDKIDENVYHLLLLKYVNHHKVNKKMVKQMMDDIPMSGEVIDLDGKNTLYEIIRLSLYRKYELFDDLVDYVNNYLTKEDFIYKYKLLDTLSSIYHLHFNELSNLDLDKIKDIINDERFKEHTKYNIKTVKIFGFEENINEYLNYLISKNDNHAIKSLINSLLSILNRPDIIINVINKYEELYGKLNLSYLSFTNWYKNVDGFITILILFLDYYLMMIYIS